MREAWTGFRSLGSGEPYFDRKVAMEWTQEKLEEFVVRWEAAAAPAQVANAMGVSLGAAIQLARRLRDQGVGLKNFKRGRGGKVDIEKLKAVCAVGAGKR